MSLDGGSAGSDAYVCGGRCGGGGGGGGESSFMAKPPAPFVLKTYHMVDDPTTNDIISWDSTGTSFIVWQPLVFAAEIMRNYFRHNNFSSFVTQLSTYSFSKISWDRWEFQNVYFQRGNNSSLRNVKRKTSGKQDIRQQQQAASPTEAATGEISMATNGFLDQEIKNLRDEHTLLNKELIMLKNQIEELVKELEMIKKESESCKRSQEKLDMFVKQVLLKDGIGDMTKGKCSGLKNVNAYMKLQKMLMMDDGVINSSEIVGEGETLIHQPSNAIDMKDLIEGPAHWVHYAKVLGS
ncbi:winged helix/forkhead transcription factor [Lithospermum erythrorhizon]|uniref:Winged helix/forkhead transcription factor n=1 Tax=Lithospermum erythrorhizon TaxID=34254 RepID=A0AAV3QV88_LITER